MDKRRFLFLLLFLLSAFILGFLLYIVFFKSEPARPTPTTPPGEPTATSTQFPEAEPGTPSGSRQPGRTGLPTGGARAPGRLEGARAPIVQTVVSDATRGVAMSGKNTLNYYNEADGRFYRLGRDGKPELLSDTVFYNVENVTWSPTKDAGILEYPDGAKIYYDFETRRQVTLPKYWEDFSFSAQGDKIAAKSLGYSTENRWLVTSNPDGSGVALVAALGDNADKVTVDWSPNNQIVGLSRTGRPLGADRQEVLFVGLHGENFKSTIVEGHDLRSEWSPDGKRLLYSVHNAANDFKPELWVVNADGETIGSGRRLLRIQTWADKCGFADANTVYCGVPETLDRGVGFAPALSNSTPDRLVKIDITTGEWSLLPLDDNHVIDTITINADEKKLYFTDKQLSGIFTVNLK